MFCNTPALGELTIKDVLLYDVTPVLFSCQSSFNVLLLLWRVGTNRWLAIPVRQSLVEKVKALQTGVSALFANPPGGYVYEITQQGNTYTTTPHSVMGE